MSHDAMTFADFVIGEHFYTATGRWRCTDKGTRVVVAVKHDVGDGSNPDVPQHDAEIVFDEYDFGGCSKESFKENE